MGAGPVPDVDLQALEGPDAAWNLGHSVAAWQQSCKKTGGAMHRNPFLVGGLGIMMIPWLVVWNIFYVSIAWEK